MSRRAAVAALATTTALAVVAAGLDGRTPASGQAVTVLRDVAYYTGPEASARYHRLDLYLPDGHASSPAVLFLHGGDWASGDKSEVPGELYDNVGQALAARGVAVAIANYRLSHGGPGSVVHPAHAIDAARAAAYVRALLIAGGAEPVRLYLVGHDAGAHLAALIATNPRFLADHGLAPSDLAGVVGLSGVYGIDPNGTDHAVVFGIDPVGRRDASPIHHVGPGTPPHLLLFAADDRAGRDEEAAALAAAIVGAGVAAVAERVADREHRSIVAEIGRPGDMVTARILYFVSGGSLATITPPPPASSTPSPTPTATPTALPVLPPAQPESGPGGAARPHRSARLLRSDAAPGAYWMWLPDEPPAAAPPVVLFVPHGPARDASSYARWLEHTARGGAVVIAPLLSGEGRSWVTESRTAMAVALADLEGLGWATSADGAAYVGHGSGALVAGSVASDWLPGSLPMPRALMLVTPRRSVDVGVGPLRRLPRDTRTLIVAAEEDAGFDAGLERELWNGMSDIPGAWRQLLYVRSDRYGTPGLEAGFELAFTDVAGDGPDAMDWYGTWKWLDGLVGCAFRRVGCEHALGDTPEQRFMGLWADGTPVREPVVRFDAVQPERRVARLPLALR